MTSSGATDLMSLKNVSSKLLLIMKHRGHLHTQNLSVYAKEALRQPTAAHTSYFSEHSQYQKRLSVNALRLAQKRAKAFLDYSTKDLATMDSQGIKLLGVEFEYDYSDRSWAE